MIIRASSEKAGSIKAWGAATAPAGWLLCYGQAVSRTTYARLYNAIGTSFGTGDGSTTFNLPDLRGRVPVGKDDMGGSAASRVTAGASGVAGATLGATGGAETHTLTTAQLPAHHHGVDGYISTGGGGNNFVLQGTGANNPNVTTGDTGSGSAHNNMQPSQIVTYIVKV